MALDADELTNKIETTLEMTDKDGNPVNPEKMAKAISVGLVTALKSCTTMNPTVLGTGIATNAPAPNAGQFVAGKAINGKFVGLTPAPIISEGMAILTEGVDPKYHALMKSRFTAQATAIVGYFTASGMIQFDKVEGICPALLPIPPPFPGAPGALIGGRAKNGKVIGLNGPALTNMVASAMGLVPIPPKMIDFYTAITDYVTENIEVEYLANSVNGGFGVGGGALSGGIAVGGIVN